MLDTALDVGEGGRQGRIKTYRVCVCVFLHSLIDFSTISTLSINLLKIAN